MLYEIRNTRQIEGEGFRRWFTSDDLDLIVWYRDDMSFDGFQLCYNKSGKERALTWRTNHSYSHLKVDSGEVLPSRNMTPILVPDGVFNKNVVLTQFIRESAKLEPQITALIKEKIEQYPG